MEYIVIIILGITAILFGYICWKLPDLFAHDICDLKAIRLFIYKHINGIFIICLSVFMASFSYFLICAAYLLLVIIGH
jgi:hypothetical protein